MTFSDFPWRNLKGTICKNFALKYPIISRPVLYILLSWLLTISQMFPTIFKSWENCDFNQGNGALEQGGAGSRQSMASYPRYPRFPLVLRGVLDKCGSCSCSVYQATNVSLFLAVVMEHNYSLPIAAGSVDKACLILYYPNVAFGNSYVYVREVLLL